MIDLDTPIARSGFEPTDRIVENASASIGEFASSVADELPSSGDLKALLDQAQAMLTDTVDATMTLIRERPLVATAIVGGVAAAATAGAAYGISRMNQDRAVTDKS